MARTLDAPLDRPAAPRGWTRVGAPPQLGGLAAHLPPTGPDLGREVVAGLLGMVLVLAAAGLLVAATLGLLWLVS